MTQEDIDEYQSNTLILANIAPYYRKGIDQNWLLLWEQVELWYGDIKNRETAAELLLRLQAEYNLTNKI